MKMDLIFRRTVIVCYPSTSVFLISKVSDDLIFLVICNLCSCVSSVYVYEYYIPTSILHHQISTKIEKNFSIFFHVKQKNVMRNINRGELFLSFSERLSNMGFVQKQTKPESTFSVFSHSLLVIQRYNIYRIYDTVLVIRGKVFQDTSFPVNSA